MKGPLSRKVLAAAAGLALAAALPARAGLPLRDPYGQPMRWDLGVEQPNVVGGRITYFLDPGGSLEEPPGDVTERDALDAAILAWAEVPGSRVRFLEDGTRVAFDRDGSDRVNFIGWKEFFLGPFTLAATFSTSTDGVLTDADVILNDTAAFFLWSTTDPGLPGYADIQTVVTHETGHVLGLDHTPVLEATMAWLLPVGSISHRTLEDDDVGAVLEAYPAASDPGRGSVIGTVRIGKRRARRGVPVFALDARTGAPAGCGLTGDDGIYRILGLEPGPYFVVATQLASTAPYSKWWASAPAGLLPAIREAALPGGGREPELVQVRAGFPEVHRDVVMARHGRRTSGEPDGSPGEARPLGPGGFASGAFETLLDEDWYRFESDGVNALDVRVRSWGLGAAADPELAVLAPDGVTVLASDVDLRPPIDPANTYGPAGVDRDPLVAGFLPAAAGTYFLRVRAQPQSDGGSPASFYLLHVLPSAGVPDARRTAATVAPASTRVGGPEPVLRADPRDGRGDPLGPGAAVTASRSDGGPDIVLADRGDGVFEAPVPLPAAPGAVALSLAVATPSGRCAVPGAAVFTVAGPADAARSVLEATPRRVEADGASTALLVYEPRDAAGRALGPGLDVVFVLEGPPAGSVGPAADRGDGTYAATLVAPAIPGSTRVAVGLGGAATGTSHRVGFGWDLALVAADLGAEAAAVEGIPGLSRGDAVSIGRAGDSLDALVAALAAGDEPAAARAAAAAAAAFARAGRSPLYPDGTLSARETAEALRRRAGAVVAGIVLTVPDPSAERALGRARALIARSRSSAGDPARSARFAAAAVRKVRHLL